MKKCFLILMLIMGIGGILIFNIFKKSLATEVDDVDNFNIKLSYNEDVNVFKNDLFNFIDLIDNSLFSMSSYNMSNELNENYDFLTNFAISLILNNEDVYKDDILYGDEYVYEDDWGNKYTTNKYIDEDIIYDITNNVFGKTNYMILNEQLRVNDKFIPLLLIKEDNIFMEIDEILDIVKFSNEYNVYVGYKNVDFVYIYKFLNIDGRLFVINVDIKE